MRARNIKPKFFKHPLLAPADPLYALVFEGLWCLADRNGRLEDIPFGIHLEVNPGREPSGTERALEWLEQQGFIERYEVAGKRFIQVINFGKHQLPHHREPSLWPEQETKAQGQPRARPGPDQGQPVTSPELASSESLFSESGILNPESCSLNPVYGPAQGKPRPARARRKRRDQRATTTKPRASTRMPDDYKPSAGVRAWAAENTPDVDFEYELGKCRDHTFRTARSDWDAVMRNWLRTAHESAHAPRKQSGKQSAAARALTSDEVDARDIDKAIDVGLSDEEIFRHLQFVPLDRIRERRAERGPNGQH